MEKNNWTWRTGEKSMKEFYKLSYVDKLSYVKLLENLSQQERSSTDLIILNQFSKNINKSTKFLSLLEDVD
jgi:hypothetical protein